MVAGVAELCEAYKADKRATGVALIADRKEALRLLAAFSLYPLPPWRRPRLAMPDDPRERWLWLWAGYDGGPMKPKFLDGMAGVAGINAETAYRVWPAIMTSRVLFPDGTISDEGTNLLQAHVTRSLNKQAARPVGRPRKDEEK